MILQYYRILQGENFLYILIIIYYFLLNLLFIQNGWIHTDWSFNSPSWSVSVELLAYFLFFFIIRTLSKKSYKIYTAFIIFIYIGLILQITSINLPMFNSQVGKVLLCFFTGCLLSKFQELIQRKQKQFFCCCICGIILFYIYHRFLYSDMILLLRSY